MSDDARRERGKHKLSEIARVPAFDPPDAFTDARHENANAIADLALMNFIEMRDKVSSAAFLAKKRLEKVLHRLFPQWFTPLYNMVTFSNIPYAEARRRAAAQIRTVVGVAVTLAVLVIVIVALVVVGLLRGT